MIRPPFFNQSSMNFKSAATRFPKSFIFSGIVLFFTYLMARIIFPYFSWKWDVDFLMTKQFIIHLDHYRLAFYTHIFSSILVLFSGSILFSSYILKSFPRLHRNFGKLYVGILLFLCAPSGMVMAFYANGGIWVKVSFIILTPLWWYFTFKGYTTIRKRKIIAHKRWMIRSYALTLSAISLRAYQFILGHFTLIDVELQYLVISWVSWVGNLILAELIIQFSKEAKRINNSRPQFLIYSTVGRT